MIKIREAIVVEGRYDKNTLSQIVDAPIFETNGFGIFRDKAQMALLRKVAMTRGIVVLTDSDGAGFVIRNHLKSAIEPQYLKHAYIPDVYGKEKRKQTAGKEGKLGVEGMSPRILEEALRKAGATIEGENGQKSGAIIKQDMVDLGLSGGNNSRLLRNKLIQKLDFPEKMSANALLQALNLLYTKSELEEILRDLEKENG